MARKTYDEKTDSPEQQQQQQPPSGVPPPYHDPRDGLYPLREKHQEPSPTLPPNHTRRLHILAATWGGITITPLLASMISSQQELPIDLATLGDVIRPDPAFGKTKTLAVVYQLDGQEGPALVLVNEQYPVARKFVVSKDTLEGRLAQAHRNGTVPPAVTFLPVPFSVPPTSTTAAPYGVNAGAAAPLPPPVQILAATYGPKHIDTPAVLRELADFFDGRNVHQIRMGNGFFREDPLRGQRKEWSVFFRFGYEGRVQCVTGWEDGALEVPWSPWI
jgi:hypothetical protein